MKDESNARRDIASSFLLPPFSCQRCADKAPPDCPLRRYTFRALTLIINDKYPLPADIFSPAHVVP
jgi:hypothetical protein